MQQVLEVVFTSLHTPRQQYEFDFSPHLLKKEEKITSYNLILTESFCTHECKLQKTHLVFTSRHQLFSAVSTKLNIETYRKITWRIESRLLVWILGHLVLFIILILTGWTFQNSSLFSSSPHPQHRMGNYYLYYRDKYNPCDLWKVASQASGPALFRIMSFFVIFLPENGWMKITLSGFLT